MIKNLLAWDSQISPVLHRETFYYTLPISHIFFFPPGTQWEGAVWADIWYSTSRLLHHVQRLMIQLPSHFEPKERLHFSDFITHGTEILCSENGTFSFFEIIKIFQVFLVGKKMQQARTQVPFLKCSEYISTLTPSISSAQYVVLTLANCISSFSFSGTTGKAQEHATYSDPRKAMACVFILPPCSISSCWKASQSLLFKAF